jgi:hypothetical protein
MCKYCEKVKTKNGGLPKFLISKSYDITGLHVTLEGSVFMDVNLIGTPKLYFGLTDNDDTLMQGSIEIKYCPICGEKLEA